MPRTTRHLCTLEPLSVTFRRLPEANRLYRELVTLLVALNAHPVTHFQSLTTTNTVQNVPPGTLQDAGVSDSWSGHRDTDNDEVEGQHGCQQSGHHTGCLPHR